MVGFGPISGAPIGGLPSDFHIVIPVEAQTRGPALIQVVSLVDRELISRIHKNPEFLKTIDRRLFEKLVAELFNGFGYDVELTQQTRDGGKDIIAVRRREVDVRYLIECKRPDPGNAVAVTAVRELYGVKVSDGATKAIIATTTHLSPDARLFVEKHRWELEAREYGAIQEWVAAYLEQK